MRPKVLISNATRLHAHHHAFALQKAGTLLRFVTSIWNKPEGMVGRLVRTLPGRAGKTARSFMAKRSHPHLQGGLVEQRWLEEIARLIADAATLGRLREVLHYLHKGMYDRAVARRVTVLKPDVVVGYEISCAHTFASAKRIGATTVLDLAGLHHDFTAAIAARHEAGTRNSWLVERLRARKQRELMSADHILTISHLARDTLVAQGVAEERISVVRLGVSLDVFAPKTTAAVAGRFRILFVGNLSRAKGVDALLQACRELALPDAEIVLVGSHAEQTFLEPYAGLYTHVPFLEHTELATEYQRADVFVLPTLYDSWGMVVSEAMACGTPVIVTENCGAKELVTPECGWVVPPGDVAALKAALLAAFSDRSRLVEMGRNARAAVEGMGWENYHAAIAQRVNEVWLQSRSAPAMGDMADRSHAAL